MKNEHFELKNKSRLTPMPPGLGKKAHCPGKCVDYGTQDMLRWFGEIAAGDSFDAADVLSITCDPQTNYLQ